MGYKKKKLLVGFILLLTTIGLYWFAVPKDTPWIGKDSHILGLANGLLAGVAVLLFQFIIDNQRDGELEVLQQTLIKGVLASRDKEEYYRHLISEAKREIIVFGVTASRFLEHFGDTNHPDESKRVLLSALARNVKVRFLLASDLMLNDSKDKNKNTEAKRRITAINLQYPHNPIELKYYDHPPTHSMVVTDDHLMVGPVFPGRESQHTFTLHVLKGGPVARDYLDNFEEEWARF